MQEPTRETRALLMLKTHFNKVNTYPLEEKIRIANMIIDDGLKDYKASLPDYSKQLELKP